MNKETLSSGVYTFITFYLLLSILSKGLEKEYNYKITKQTFLLLPYSSAEKLFYTNAVILGKKDESKFKINLNLKIPLLVDSTLKIGEGACPYIRGVNGKNLNDELYESMISFLEELYSEVFIEIIRIYNDKNKNWTPDYANYSLGRFENVNIKHLENNPNIFERVYI